MSVILDGKLFAAKLKEDLLKDTIFLKDKYKLTPRVVSVIFGEDAASHSYVISQQKTAESLGVLYELKVLPVDVSSAQAVKMVEGFSHDRSVHGIIVNKPVPAGIDFFSLINAITPTKDIEGMNFANSGMLLMNKTRLWPCTPAAAWSLLKSSEVSLQGKTAVILGRSEIVGKPMALLLLLENMTVTICHSKTVDLQSHLKNADVIVAAIGQPLFLKGDWIKPGAIVIDVGINRVEGKIVGDVDFDSCQEKAAFITPVPGGVGPVTSVMLMKNVIEAFKQQVGAL